MFIFRERSNQAYYLDITVSMKTSGVELNLKENSEKLGNLILVAEGEGHTFTWHIPNPISLPCTRNIVIEPAMWNI